MSRLCHLARITVGACTTIILLGISFAAHAGGFLDAFKDFVLGSEAQAGSLTVQLPVTSQAVDCMHCHDGTVGPQINMKHAGSPMKFRGQVSIDHPVGMDYGQYAHSNPDTYVMPARMDKRIVLEDGKVTCVSCHRTRSEPATQPDQPRTAVEHCNVAEGYTTGPNPSRLCMGCHAM